MGTHYTDGDALITCIVYKTVCPVQRTSKYSTRRTGIGHVYRSLQSTQRYVVDKDQIRQRGNAERGGITSGAQEASEYCNIDNPRNPRAFAAIARETPASLLCAAGATTSPALGQPGARNSRFINLKRRSTGRQRRGREVSKPAKPMRFRSMSAACALHLHWCMICSPCCV